MANLNLLFLTVQQMVFKHTYSYILIFAAFMYCGCLPVQDAVEEVRAAGIQLETAQKDTTNTVLFDELMEEAREKAWFQQDLGKIMVNVGQWFEGKPYVAGSLDESAYEQLVIKLDGFDCVTFVESALALSRVIQDQSYNYTQFVEHMQSQRYRDGQMDGYCSRLHYFSEWILDNGKRGAVKNITADIGGVRFEKQLNFMSNHRASYKQLENDSLFAELMKVEQRLQGLVLYYIPQDEISSAYANMKAGDIIALATDIGGLDVAHTGLVYKHENGNAGLLHASTARGVIVSPDLQEYVENNKRQVGIVVARPLEISSDG